MEKAIETLLSNQATFESQLALTNQQIAETNRIVQLSAETQTEFIQIVTDSIQSLVAAHSRTDARLDRLAATVERLILGQSGPA
jgi:hypothetical protein